MVHSDKQTDRQTEIPKFFFSILKNQSLRCIFKLEYFVFIAFLVSDEKVKKCYESKMIRIMDR